MHLLRVPGLHILLKSSQQPDAVVTNNIPHFTERHREVKLPAEGHSGKNGRVGSQRTWAVWFYSRHLKDQRNTVESVNQL